MIALMQFCKAKADEFPFLELMGAAEVSAAPVPICVAGAADQADRDGNPFDPGRKAGAEKTAACRES